MKIKIKSDGENRDFAKRYGIEYEVGKEIEAILKGSVNRSADSYQLIEDGRPVSSDKNGNAYIPLCNGIDDNGTKYALFASVSRNNEYVISAFTDPQAYISHK